MAEWLECATLSELVEALRTRLLPQASPAWCAGLCGTLLPSQTPEANVGDLLEMVLPGFAALGWGGEIITSPFSPIATRRPTPLVWIRCSSNPFVRWDTFEASEASESLAESRLMQVLLTESRAVPQDNTLPLFCMRLKPATHKGGKRANLHAALLRLVACGTAFPERFPAPTALEVWKIFLSEVIGAQRTPFHSRLRYALYGIEEEAWGDAWLALKEAALWETGLSQPLFQTLLEPETEPVPVALRGELVYLARAGKAPLRAMAVARLAGAMSAREASRTLESLRYDQNYWVRAVANRVCPPKGGV